MEERKVIVCRGLKKSYGRKAALKGIDLELGAGRIIGLLGPNGSGKTTLIKLLCGLLHPTAGEVRIGGYKPGPETKALISYLPDRPYFEDWMRVRDALDMFTDFYGDFDRNRAAEMCESLGITEKMSIKTMSKGTREKLQLVLVMSRSAMVYLLDEPIAGVDPAARDYILQTILTNYNPAGTVIISTHLIADIEKVLDEAIFLKEGVVVRHDAVDDIREKEGKTLDALFREIFRVMPEKLNKPRLVITPAKTSAEEAPKAEAPETAEAPEADVIPLGASQGEAPCENEAEETAAEEVKEDEDHA